MSTPERVTLEDVAKRAGVSRATASRVVRGDVGVTDKMARAVRAAVDALGYIPNTAARALVTHRTGTVAVIIPEADEIVFSDPFLSRTIRAVSAALETWDIQLVMAFADSTDQGHRTASFLRTGAVDGAIVVSHHQFRGQVESFLEAGPPIIFIGRPVTATPPETWVDTDNLAGGRLAALHLLDDGVRRPAIVTGPLDMVAAQDRLRGFREAAAPAGVLPVVLEGAFTARSGRAAGEALVPRIVNGEIDGVFFSSDLMALAALDAWAARGVRAPNDVLVVSYDDSSEAAAADLTSVTNSAEDLGRAASIMLHDVLAGAWDGRPVTMPASLSVRASSTPSDPARTTPTSSVQTDTPGLS